MTPEALTQARVQEAVRLVPYVGQHSVDHAAEVALNMARLIAEDWKPAPAVDPLLAEAREFLAEGYRSVGKREAAKKARHGEFDQDGDLAAVIAALRTRQPIFTPWTAEGDPPTGCTVLTLHRSGEYSVERSFHVEWAHMGRPQDVVAYWVIETLDSQPLSEGA